MAILASPSVGSRDFLERQFKRRSSITLRPNSCWKIETGLVRTLTWLEDGTVVTLGLWGPGDWISKSLLMVDPYQVECLTLVEATHFPITEWQERDAAFLAHLQQTQELLTIRSNKRVETMLLQLLSWLAKRFGQKMAKGQLIDLRLTHQDLAEILGLTRVTITRVLSQFEQQGLIQRSSLQRIILKEEEVWHYQI